MSTMPVSQPLQQQQPLSHNQQPGQQNQQQPPSSTPSSQTSNVPKKVTRYPSKNVPRPFPKGDITVDLQKKAQELLLTAAKNYEGYNPFNLELIAVSFEHKVFSESTTREEYIRKIKQKLNEWHYTETSGNPQQAQTGSKPSSPTAVRSNSVSEGSSGGHKKSISGSSRSPKDKPRNKPSPPAVGAQRPPTAPSPPSMQTGMPGISSTLNRSPQSQNVQPTYNMGAPGSQIMTTGPPRPPPLQSGPTTPPNMLSFSPISPPSNANFVTIFDPSFIDNFDLNDPTVRNEWIAAVRDNIYAEVISSGTGMGGYPQPPGSSGSHRNSLVGLPENAMDLDPDREFKYIPNNNNMGGQGHQRNATGGSGSSNTSQQGGFVQAHNQQGQQQWLQNSHPGIGVSHNPGDMYMNGGQFNGGFNGHLMNEWFEPNP